MGDVTLIYKVCSHCGGVIPPDVPQINNISGRVLVVRVNPEQTGADSNGEPVIDDVQRFGPDDFDGLDFCCTAHMLAFLETLDQVPEPDKAFSKPAAKLVDAAHEVHVRGVVPNETVS